MRAFFLIPLLIMTAAQAATNDYAAASAPAGTGFSAPGPDIPSPLRQTPHVELIRRLAAQAPGASSDDASNRAALAGCQRCHASDMHSQNSFLPVLQGQNLEYLLAKILLFRNDERSFHPLRSVTRALSDEQVVAISRYYAGQSSALHKSLLLNLSNPTPAQTQAPANDSLRGCSQCHGTDGNGSGLIPAISGQNQHYLSYRIREIAAENSRVHRHSVAPVNCQIDKVDLAASKSMATRLSLVLDPARVARGQTIYVHNCSRCHDPGEQGAPKMSDKAVWEKRIHQGLRKLIRNTLAGKRSVSVFTDKRRLSRTQLLDAIHFMLYQVSIHSE